MRLHHKHHLSMQPHMRNCSDFVFSTRFLGWPQKSNSLLISCTALAVLGQGLVFLFVVFFSRHVLHKNRTHLTCLPLPPPTNQAKWKRVNSTMHFCTTQRCWDQWACLIIAIPPRGAVANLELRSDHWCASSIRNSLIPKQSARHSKNQIYIISYPFISELMIWKVCLGWPKTYQEVPNQMSRPCFPWRPVPCQLWLVRACDLQELIFFFVI